MSHCGLNGSRRGLYDWAIDGRGEAIVGGTINGESIVGETTTALGRDGWGTMAMGHNGNRLKAVGATAEA